MFFSESIQEKASGLTDIYIHNLFKNINFCFRESVELLSAFSIINPLSIPERDSTEFRNFENNYIFKHSSRQNGML